MIKTINLKEVASVEACGPIIDLEIEQAKKEGVSVIKIIHGYGSHGVGGDMLKETRKHLTYLKRRKVIKKFFVGGQWSLFNVEVTDLLKRCKEFTGDIDLNSCNPGITVIEV